MEGLYYPCSENKGADKLRGNHEADLCLCFRTCKMTRLICEIGNTCCFPYLMRDLNVIPGTWDVINCSFFVFVIV